jgi:transposase
LQKETELNLPNDIASCHSIIVEQQKLVAQLMSKVKELEDRLNKNSQNSNKPPSSDGLSKAKSQPAFPRKKGKKAGGQAGHKGKTLELCQRPDHIKPLLAERCPCGSILDSSKSELQEVRQVFDIPEPKLEVTEYRQLGCTCADCGAYNKGTFPQEVKARVQYGVGVRALVVLLNVGFNVPLKKVQSLFGDIYGYAINTSTILQAIQTCHERLAASEQVIKQKILASLVTHFDETGLRVEGKLHWLHTSCNRLFTYLFVHAKRGKKALLDTPSLLVQFTNWAIHDCWASYFCFTNCQHGLCGAHLLRELTALIEKDTHWAVCFKRYLLTLYHLSEQGKGVLNEAQQQKALTLFDKIWSYADQAEPPPTKSPSGKGRPKATKGRNLLKRLKEHQSQVIAFAFHKEVPFTNNQAERDLRPAKTKQKVAGTFRKLEGAKRYARIYGFISTTRKHQFSIFNELKKAFSGDTFLTKSYTS